MYTRGLLTEQLEIETMMEFSEVNSPIQFAQTLLFFFNDLPIVAVECVWWQSGQRYTGSCLMPEIPGKSHLFNDFSLSKVLEVCLPPLHPLFVSRHLSNEPLITEKRTLSILPQSGQRA